MNLSGYKAGTGSVLGRVPPALVQLHPVRVGLASAPRNEEFNDIVGVHVGHVNVRRSFSLSFILMYPRPPYYKICFRYLFYRATLFSLALRVTIISLSLQSHSKLRLGQRLKLRIGNLSRSK